MSDTQNEYGEEVQRVLLSFMLSDPTSFAISQNIIKPEYFLDKLRPAVRFIKEYSEQYKVLPTTEQVAATSKVVIDKFSEVVPQHADWYLQTIEKFCRYRALETVILEGVDMLEEGRGGEVEKRVRDAMTISLMRDLGTSYFADPLTRLERLRDKSNFVPTLWKVLDKKLYGGFTRGSLNIFAGGSGSGKSLFLQNIALNWALAGMNVVYITLELSEDLVNLRLDAMVTGIGTKDVMRDINRTAMQVRSIAMKGKVGDLRVKKFPEAGTTANDLRAYLKEYEIQHGCKPDALVVDYLDLMHPNNAKIDVSSLFTKDKYVSEELRAIGSEWDIPVVSASQLNRQSVEAQEFDHSHIAGGISKINTADNVFAIFTSINMRERGVYQIQFLKTRSAGAVGQKVELAYLPDSLRIMDPEGETDGENPLDDQTRKSTDQIRDQLRLKTNRDGAFEPTRPAGNGPISSQIQVPVAEPSAAPLRKGIGDLLAKNRNEPR